VFCALAILRIQILPPVSQSVPKSFEGFFPCLTRGYSSGVLHLVAEDYGSRAEVTADNAGCRKAKERAPVSERTAVVPVLSAGYRQGERCDPCCEATAFVRGLLAERRSTDRYNRKRVRRTSEAGPKDERSGEGVKDEKRMLCRLAGLTGTPALTGSSCSIMKGKSSSVFFSKNKPFRSGGFESRQPEFSVSRKGCSL